MSTSPVSASWATAGTSPPAFSKSSIESSSPRPCFRRLRLRGAREAASGDCTSLQFLDPHVAEIDADVVTLEPDVALLALQPGVLLVLLLVVVEIRVHQLLAVEFDQHLATLADDPDRVPLADRLVVLQLRRL